MFKTIKYRPAFPEKGFVSIEASRTWMLGLARWYRYNHRHSGIRFLTPHQLHTGAAESILENRRKVYEEARSRMPWRWTGETRNWSMIEKKDGEKLFYQTDDIQTNENQTRSGIVDAFIRAILTGEPSISDGRHALSSMRAVFACLESSQKQSKIEIIDSQM